MAEPRQATPRTTRSAPPSARAASSRRACRGSSWKRAASPRPSSTACTAAAAPARARISGSTAASCRASRHIRSTGAAPRATIISMCASANGKPRIRSGCGPTARRRWTSHRPRPSGASSTARWSCRSRLPKCWCRAASAIGIPGLMRPTANRNIIEKMAQAIVHDTGRAAEPAAEFRAGAVLRSAAAVRSVEPDRRISPHHRPAGGQRRARPCRAGGRSGGRNVSPTPAASSSSNRKALGSITAGRAETWRADYQALLANHRAALRAECEQFGWSFTMHRTDRGPTELLFAHPRAHGRRRAGRR